MSNWLYRGLFGDTALSAKPLLFVPGRPAISYAMFRRMVSRFVNLFRSQGVLPGDRIAVQVAKSPEALALYVASFSCGGVFVPLNVAYKVRELDYFIAHADPRIVVCQPESYDDLRSLSSMTHCCLLTLDNTQNGSLIERATELTPSFQPVSRGPDDLAAILYTSGTTGPPKGAMLTHRNVLANARTLSSLWEFSADDVLLHVLPIFHAHGLFVAANVTFIAGASMVFHSRFDIDDTIAALPKSTVLMGVPTIYTRLMDDPRFNRDSVSSMRLFISGSAPLLAETHSAFESRTGCRILERYGMTETTITTSNPYYGERRAGTVGQAIPDVDLRVADPDTGMEVPDGQVGVIEVKGPSIFKGYWNMPEETTEAFRPDGYFVTGDLATRSIDRYVTIVGRSKDVIISGGFNIYPKEIESVLDAIDGVIESAVIGIPHSDLGEGVLAVIVCSPDALLKEQDIIDRVATELASFKKPQAVIFADGLPRNTMGKVQKNQLRDAHRHLFGSASSAAVS